MKESFVLYTDMEDQFGALEDEEIGKLMRAIFTYVRCGEPDAELTGAAKMAFLFIRKTLDRDGEKYEQVRQARSRAGKVGAAVKKQRREQNAAQQKGAKEEAAKAAKEGADKQEEAKAPAAQQTAANKAVSVPVPESVPVSVPDTVPESVPVSGQKAKKIYGRYKNIFLAEEELSQLRQEFPGDYTQRLERLSEYMASTGKKYASPLAAIRYWARKEKENGTHSKPAERRDWQFGTVL